jgi:glycosyltransferase involved in cell wall biosynthesis
LPYLTQFAVALAEAKKRVPNLRLITIADQPLSDPPLPAEHIAWSVETESAALCRGDIGIAPTPRDRWTLGKCGFKIVQYMAAGLPVIASPVGANGQIVVPGETGYLPEKPSEWAEAIANLAGDVGKRLAMGAASRRRMEKHFPVNRAVDAWAAMLTGEGS